MVKNNDLKDLCMIMGKCPKSQDGVHRITMDPETARVKLQKGEITLKEYQKAQFCTECGEAIW